MSENYRPSLFVAVRDRAGSCRPAPVYAPLGKRDHAAHTATQSAGTSAAGTAGPALRPSVGEELGQQHDRLAPLVGRERDQTRRAHPDAIALIATDRTGCPPTRARGILAQGIDADGGPHCRGGGPGGPATSTRSPFGPREVTAPGPGFTKPSRSAPQRSQHRNRHQAHRPLTHRPQASAPTVAAREHRPPAQRPALPLRLASSTPRTTKPRPLLLVQGGDEISGDGGFRSPRQSRRRLVLRSAQGRARVAATRRPSPSEAGPARLAVRGRSVRCASGVPSGEHLRKSWISVERWACPDDHAAPEATLRPKQKNVCGGGVFGVELTGLGPATSWCDAQALRQSFLYWV